MSNFFHTFYKYRYGFIVALLTFLVVFIYMNLITYQRTYEIEGWFGRQADIEQEPLPEQIELKPENIEIPAGYGGDVKNMVSDANDQRKKSTKDYSESEAFARNPDEAIKKLEEQYRQESGGEQKRAQIKQELADKKRQLESAAANPKGKPSTSNQKGGDTQFSGNTMVKFSLSNRTAFENNKWHIRNPGYTCGPGAAGTATMRVTVDRGGRVVDAVLAPESSNTSNPCILEQARKYAMMSRFNPSTSAPDRQTGTITYTFVSQ